MTDPLQASSERVVETDRLKSMSDYASYRFHRHTYEWAASLCEGLEVVDYGCGTGYGPTIVADKARKVDAFDVSEAAVRYAAETYPAPNLTFRRIEGPLPTPDASVDAVLSFQVIEHVEPEPYLSEIRRVLRADGFALFATPNRTQRLYRWQQPWNRWHLTEYDPDGFTHLLAPYFSSVELFELMGSKELLDAQHRRWKKTRIMTVPLTLPIVPGRIRRPALSLLSSLASRQGTPLTDEPGGKVWVQPLSGSGCDILAIARV